MAPAGSGDDSYISDLTLPDFTTSYNVLRLETGSMMSGDLITRLVWRRSRIETTFNVESREYMLPTSSHRHRIVLQLMYLTYMYLLVLQGLAGLEVPCEIQPFSTPRSTVVLIGWTGNLDDCIV